MITDNGKVFIKRFMAGQSGAVVGSISVGVSDAAAASTDTRLGFELARVPVEVTDYDFSTDELVFKASLDETVSGEIHEVAIWSSEINASAGNQEGKLITSFDSETEEWDTSTFATANTRLGNDSLEHTPAASTSSTSLLTGIELDFIEYTSADVFILALYIGNSNCSSAVVRLRTDESNYYEFTLATPSTGYQFAEFSLGSAVAVGTPDWADISEVEVVTTATAGGAAAVQYDGFRIEDTDSIDPEYGLIARFVLPSPTLKQEGIVKDVEYALPVTV